MSTQSQINAVKIVVDTDITNKTAQASCSQLDVGNSIKNVADLTLSPYKSFVALLNQSGTSDPVATIIINEIGVTPVITRTGAGGYSLTITGAFATAAKCVGFPTQQVLSSSNISNISDFSCFRQTANNFRIVTRTNAVATDNLLADFPIEIRVYN